VAVYPPFVGMRRPPARTRVRWGSVAKVFRTSRLVISALVAALVCVAPAATAPVAPVLVTPDDGATVSALPAFKWEPVADASNYEFELDADPAFDSPIVHVTTKNTRAAAKDVVANGTYYWRVRGVTGTGALGDWSETRSFDLAWTAQPSLLKPANGATLTFPNEPLELNWSVVPGAAKYLVRVATDPALGSLVFGEPIETAATSFTLNDPLAPGTYYWRITPLDAEDHPGGSSTIASFTWVWPSTTDTDVTDLVPAPEVYDPRFSWDPVPGAAGYEVEVNFSSDWAESSKVCCDPIKGRISTLGTSLTPAEVLANNTYYWRVRAIDPSNNAGVWNEGPTFTKTFDNVPPVTAPSIKNLRMADNVSDPATDAVPGTAVVDTGVPVVLWDAVAGASSYQVNITQYEDGACDWTQSIWQNTPTTLPAWTPLGWSGPAGDPYPSIAIADDLNKALATGASYCVRVRAVDRSSASSGAAAIFGDWSYLPANNEPGFLWTGPPASTSCSPCQMPGTAYNAPLTGTSLGEMPLFTWDEVPGAESYYVLVSRDANFTTIVDYAYTRIPAYAPRRSPSQSIGYADETTLYYWAVLPANNADGSGVSTDPLSSNAQSFTKQSTPPTLESPIDDEAVNTPATEFQWSPVLGARRYRVQVAQNPTFSNPIDDVVTDSTAYTSNTTYPSDTTLYWRVRADAENSTTSMVGLTWSEAGTFTKQLPKPVLDPDNPTSGSLLPTIRWNTVPGAVSYDVHIVEPDGDDETFTNIPAPAATFTKLTGVGVATWQVRANFPTDSSAVVHGPYSLPGTFTHTIPQPANPGEETGDRRLIFNWDPRPRADHYRVQVSTRADFLTTVENVNTQTTVYAPLLNTGTYTAGGNFFWRVAVVDTDSNMGDFTPVRSFALPPVTDPGGGGGTPTLQEFKVLSTGYPVKGKKKKITLTVRNGSFQPVAAANVRVSGAGVTAVTKQTNASGVVTFTVRARRYPGTVTFRITKTGFETELHKKTVRPA
jgi:hypothetical protein